MIFSIEDSAINGDDDLCRAIDKILMRVEEGIHDVEINAAILEGSRFYITSRAAVREFLEQASRDSAYRAKSLKRVFVSDSDTAIQANQLAYSPLEILTENTFSDGALVETAIRIFGSKKTIAICLGELSQCVPPPIRISSGGGHGELSKLIDREINTQTQRGFESRVLVITDSDGEWPDDVKDHAINIREKCKTHKIPCPPLNMRTAENYIPDAVWIEWVKGKGKNYEEAVSALLTLTREQRDHVRIGDGNDPAWDKKNPVVAKLFNDVSPKTYDILTKINLKKKDKLMTITALSAYLDAVNAENMNKRDKKGDLREIVCQIEANL
jgi:hypothetical protein